MGVGDGRDFVIGANVSQRGSDIEIRPGKQALVLVKENRRVLAKEIQGRNIQGWLFILIRLKKGSWWHGSRKNKVLIVISMVAPIHQVPRAVCPMPWAKGLRGDLICSLQQCHEMVQIIQLL